MGIESHSFVNPITLLPCNISSIRVQPFISFQVLKLSPKDGHTCGHTTWCMMMLLMTPLQKIVNKFNNIRVEWKPSPAGDVNGDGRVGLADIVYILQDLAGLR